MMLFEVIGGHRGVVAEERQLLVSGDRNATEFYPATTGITQLPPQRSNRSVQTQAHQG